MLPTCCSNHKKKMTIDKIIAVGLAIAALIGLIFAMQKERKSNVCQDCHDCQLRDTCTKQKKK